MSLTLRELASRWTSLHGIASTHQVRKPRESRPVTLKVEMVVDGQVCVFTGSYAKIDQLKAAFSALAQWVSDL